MLYCRNKHKTSLNNIPQQISNPHSYTTLVLRKILRLATLHQHKWTPIRPDQTKLNAVFNRQHSPGWPDKHGKGKTEGAHNQTPNHVFLFSAELKCPVVSEFEMLGVSVQDQSTWQTGGDTSNSILHLVFLFTWISENLLCAIINFWAHCYIPTESSKSAHPCFLPLDRF